MAVLGHGDGLGDLDHGVVLQALAGQVLTGLAGHVVGQGQAGDLLAGHVVHIVHAGLLGHLEVDGGGGGLSVQLQQGDGGFLDGQGLKLALVAALGGEGQGQAAMAVLAVRDGGGHVDGGVVLQALAGQVLTGLAGHVVGQGQGGNLLAGHIVHDVLAGLVRQGGRAGGYKRQSQKKSQKFAHGFRLLCSSIFRCQSVSLLYH